MQTEYGYDIFIKVEPSSNPDCSWEGYSQLDNCNFLKEAVNAIWNIEGPVGFIMAGVFTTARIWKQFFGSSCDTFATDADAFLWYAQYDSTGHATLTQSFDDFVPFGGWKVNDFIAKQIGGDVKVPLLCESKAWYPFVDLIWLQN